MLNDKNDNFLFQMQKYENNHLSKLKFVTLTVLRFGFFMGIPSKQRLSPVEIGLSGISIPL